MSYHGDVLPPVQIIRPAVATLLGCVDEIIVNPAIPTAATAIHEGRLLLLLGDLYLKASPEARNEILNHETGHFLMAHIARQKDRDQQRWNVVIDASVHFTRVCDWKLIEADARTHTPDFHLWTFDRIKDKTTGLPMMPMPPEMAYERLPDEPGGAGDGKDCGSMRFSKDDGSARSLAKRSIVGGKIVRSDPDFLKDLIGAAGHDSGSRVSPELKGPRPWIKQVLQYLVSSRERSDRRRSWRREHRAFDELPGQSRRFARGGLFFLDASGSIPDDQLGEFLACVMATPELRGSDVIIFDTGASAMIPITNIPEIVAACKAKGGGTHIAGVGNKYRDHRPAIWITDAFTGDGWPQPHSAAEVWCVWGQGPTPPTGITIRIPE